MLAYRSLIWQVRKILHAGLLQRPEQDEELFVSQDLRGVSCGVKLCSDLYSSKLYSVSCEMKLESALWSKVVELVVE
jgi:hypothetical protein